jgi:hypothetical protein
MARNRMLNPEFWLDEEIAELSAHARLFYMGLWGICDDNYATFPNRPDWLKAQIFPYEKVDVTKLIKELEGTKKIVSFEHDGKTYYWIKNFFKYQKIDKPSKPKYPVYESSRGVVGESSPSPRAEDKIKEDKGRKDKTSALSSFERFWSCYPKKVSKKKAEQIWLKISPNEALVETILKSVETYKLSSQWVKDGGQFIPHATTWLNQERWNDEVVSTPLKAKAKTLKL